LSLGPLFQPLPVCVLAAIILASLVNILKKISEFHKYWSESSAEGIVWILTFLSIVLLSVDIGLVVGIVSSVLATLYNAAAPQVNILGRTKEGVWLDAATYKTEDDGIRVIQVSGPLYFLVFESVRVRILEELGLNPSKVDTKYRYNHLILDISNVSYLDQKGASLINWIETKLPGLGFAVVATPLQKCKLDLVEAEVFPTYIDAVLTVQNNFTICDNVEEKSCEHEDV
jgi:solute carrier family 26 protein